MKFHIALSPDYHDKPPKIKVDINNVVIWDGEIFSVQKPTEYKSKILEYEKEFNDEEEIKLNITMYGKTDDQTIVEDGKPTKDQLLHINGIEIDDIDIENLADPFWGAEYTVNTGTKTRVTTLGENGTWCLTLKEPFYLWLLERQTW